MGSLRQLVSGVYVGPSPCMLLRCRRRWLPDYVHCTWLSWGCAPAPPRRCYPARWLVVGTAVRRRGSHPRHMRYSPCSQRASIPLRVSAARSPFDLVWVPLAASWPRCLAGGGPSVSGTVNAASVGGASSSASCVEVFDDTGSWLTGRWSLGAVLLIE